MDKTGKGLLLLWIYILLFASSNAIVERLSQLGVNHLIHGHNPISFCNVLFLGNLIAGIVFFIKYRKEIKFSKLKKLKLNQWGSLTLITICNAILGPGFYFLALLMTSVINVILISSTEIVWALILGYFLLNEKPSKFTVLGSLMAITGVIVTFILYQPETMPIAKKMTQANLGTGAIGKFTANIPKAGELFAILGGLFSGLGDILVSKYSKNIPTAIFTNFRTTMGAIFFFIVAISVFGPSHFADLFSPFLWTWMLLYGGVILALSIFSFSKAAQITTSEHIAIGNAFFPVAGIIFAFLIVGELPDRAQVIGGIIILIGVGIGLYDSLTQGKKKKTSVKKLIGFKGI